MKNFKKEKYFNYGKDGYAILFAVILVSVISMIALGLSNTTYKELIITSVAKDSQMAFYQSDMATECGLYLEQKKASTLSGLLPYACGVISDGTNIQLQITSNPNGTFDVKPTDISLTSPCFDINIDKTDPNVTTIKSNGYNMCDKTNFKTVERSIQISY